MTRNEDDIRDPQMPALARAEKRRDLVGNCIILSIFDVVFWVIWWKTAPGTAPLPVIPTMAIAIILAEKFVDLSDFSPESNRDDDWFTQRKLKGSNTIDGNEWLTRDELLPIHNEDDTKPEHRTRQDSHNQ